MTFGGDGAGQEEMANPGHRAAALGLIQGSRLPGTGQQPSLRARCRCLWLCQESKVKLLVGCLLETTSCSAAVLCSTYQLVGNITLLHAKPFFKELK